MKLGWLKYVGTQCFAAHVGDAIALGLVYWNDAHSVWLCTEKGRALRVQS